MTSVTIPDSITSIGNYAFNNCRSISAINVDAGNEYYTSEDGVLFNKDKSILLQYPAGKTAEEYVVPDSVKSIGSSAFAYSLLTSITIPDGVTAIGDFAIHNCAGLTSIIIPDSVTSIGPSAFSLCKKLSSVTIPDGVATIENGTFEECSSLKSVTIPDSVTSIGVNAFAGCVKLDSIAIPDSVKNIEECAFSRCEKITSVTIPESVASIGRAAFYNCDNLTSITIENPECEIYDSEDTVSDTATIYGYEGSTAQTYAEKYNRKFENLVDAPSVSEVASGTCGENVTWTVDSEGTLTISGTGPMVTDYFGMPEWGYDENNLPLTINKVVIEEGVTAISGTAFNGCGMTAIEIADSVTTIGNFAFMDCCNLTEAVLPENLTEISNYAFEGCSALKKITIPASLTAVGHAPFYGCTELTEIIVAEENTGYVSVDGVLYDKDMTCLISYPCGKTATNYSIPDGVTIIGDGAFGGAPDLINVEIPDSVTNIGVEAFSECNDIKIITIPKSVVNIDKYAFSKCTVLESIVIENPDCSICDYSYTICNTMEHIDDNEIKYQGHFDGTIYGYEGSTAQTYAEKYNRKFVCLGNMQINMLGDINEDGKVDARDASSILSLYADISSGGRELTDKEKAICNVNGDASVDARDASVLLAYYADLQSGSDITLEEFLNKEN